MSKEENIETWPDLAIGLYDKLTGRNAEITYEFDNLTVHVPGKVGAKDTAPWNISGKLKISTTEGKAK